jgi:chromate reductase
MRILGIAGSLRAGSLNAQLLRLAAKELPGHVQLELYEGLAEIPPFDQDLEDLSPDAVDALKAAIADADAVLVATPEYNGSVPGQLKNALDWVSRPISESPIRSKPVAVIGASPGSFGAVWAQRELKKVLGLMGARVLDVELAVTKADRRLEDPDPELREQLAGVVRTLAAEAEPARVPELTSTVELADRQFARTG